MSTRTRQSTRTEEELFDEFETSLDLDTLSDDELEELLFEEEVHKSKSPFNLPSMAGLSMIVVGILYMLQQLGVFTGSTVLPALASMLPWLAGILIILLGFGVLSWRPKKKKRSRTVKKEIKMKSGKKVVIEAPPKTSSSGKKRLRKSLRDKKIAGVAGGLGEYFGVDPTLVRIGFVIGAIATQFIPVLVAYFILAIIMSSSKTGPSDSDSDSDSDRRSRRRSDRDSDSDSDSDSN